MSLPLLLPLPFALSSISLLIPIFFFRSNDFPFLFILLRLVFRFISLLSLDSLCFFVYFFASTSFGLFLFFGLFNPYCDFEAINLSIIHTGDGGISLFFGAIVDNGIIFDSPQSTRTNLSKMCKDLIDVILGNIGTQILDHNRYDFDTILTRIRI